MSLFSAIFNRQGVNIDVVQLKEMMDAKTPGYVLSGRAYSHGVQLHPYQRIQKYPGRPGSKPSIRDT